MAAVAAMAMLASESAAMVSVRVFMLRVGCWVNWIGSVGGKAELRSSLICCLPLSAPLLNYKKTVNKKI